MFHYETKGVKMPKHELSMKMTRPAKKSGGDRYETEEQYGGRPLVFYLPQEISRPKEGTMLNVKVTIEEA